MSCPLHQSAHNSSLANAMFARDQAATLLAPLYGPAHPHRHDMDMQGGTKLVTGRTACQLHGFLVHALGLCVANGTYRSTQKCVSVWGLGTKQGGSLLRVCPLNCCLTANIKSRYIMRAGSSRCLHGARGRGAVGVPRAVPHVQPVRLRPGHLVRQRRGGHGTWIGHDRAA